MTRTPSPVLEYRQPPQLVGYTPSQRVSPQRLSPQPQQPGYYVTPPRPSRNLSPRAASPTGLGRAPPGYTPRTDPPGYGASPGYVQRPQQVSPRYPQPGPSPRLSRAAAPRGPSLPAAQGPPSDLPPGVFAYFDK